jgi:hypothetical protein
MIKYILQVCIAREHFEGTIWTWQDVRPTNGKRYEFDTFEEAEKVRAMCYPGLGNDRVRIVTEVS